MDELNESLLVMPHLHNIAHTPQLTILYCGRVSLKHWWRAANVKVPYWRLYWNSHAGAVLREPAGASHPVAPPKFTLVTPNTLLNRELSRPVKEHFFTHFTVGTPFTRVKPEVLRFSAPAELIKIMRRDYTATTASSPVRDDPQRVATGLALCWYALSRLTAQNAPVLAEPSPADRRLEELLSWWEFRGWPALANRELAARVSMHPVAFCRYFQRAIGHPPHTFGLMKRIDRACLLLHFSKDSIKQIAEATGFCDRYYFSRKFRQMRGISPAAFRRQAVPMCL